MVNPNDPPDLIVTGTHGVRWGVEVTRSYPQVSSFCGKKLVSSEQMHATLRIFGEQIKEKTKPLRYPRKRSYALILQSPGPFSSLKIPVPWKEWTKGITKAICEHIVTNTNSPLRAAGAWLQPREPGNDFRIYTNAGGPQNIDVAAEEMLRQVLDAKSNALSRWNGGVSERWLLILNGYPCANDCDQVQATVNRLVPEHPGGAGLNGIFWCARSDPALIRFPLG